MAKATNNSKSSRIDVTGSSSGKNAEKEVQKEKKSVSPEMQVLPANQQKGAIDSVLEGCINNLNRQHDLMYSIREKFEDYVGHFDYTINGKEMKFSDLAEFPDNKLSSKLELLNQRIYEHNRMLELIERHFVHQFGG